MNTVDLTLPAPPELPAYPGIAFSKICIVRSEADAERALTRLMTADVIGFDTESKPVFFKGQQSDGPHLIQLASDHEVYLFPALSSSPAHMAVVKAVLESAQILKVGFGLADDEKRLFSKLAIKTRNVLDLSRAMRENKHAEMGAKTAVAKYFGLKLQKSKKISTSNWALEVLSSRQLQYAADDAQVALLVYRRWLLQKKPAIKQS